MSRYLAQSLGQYSIILSMSDYPGMMTEGIKSRSYVFLKKTTLN